jgi:hypothetical protein
LFDEHVTTMQQVMVAMSDRDRALMRLLLSCPWDPTEPSSLEAFKTLIDVLTEGIDQYTALRDVLPPSPYDQSIAN